MKNDIFEKIKLEMDKAMAFFQDEILKLRTGQASPALVEDIVVDYLETKLPLKQLGAISCSGARQILVQPWDKASIESIEKAIFRSNIGASPIVDKDVIRINLPALTEEYRKELLKLLSQKQEETRENIRQWRQEAWKDIQDLARDKEISEDEKFKAKDKLQDLVNEYNNTIKEIGERKQRELEN